MQRHVHGRVRVAQLGGGGRVQIHLLIKGRGGHEAACEAGLVALQPAGAGAALCGGQRDEQPARDIGKHHDNEDAFLSLIGGQAQAQGLPCMPMVCMVS